MILSLAECSVSVEPAWVETRLPDGRTVLGMPMHTPDYRRTAKQLGYGADVTRLNREHELTHSLLAHWLGLPCSPTFERVAHGLDEPTDLTRYEEAAILAVQAFAVALGVDLSAVAQRWANGQ